MNERKLVREEGPVDDETVQHAHKAHDLNCWVLVVEGELYGCFVGDAEDSDPEEVA